MSNMLVASLSSSRLDALTGKLYRAISSLLTATVTESGWNLAEVDNVCLDTHLFQGLCGNSSPLLTLSPFR
jgi:hypothetical protein